MEELESSNFRNILEILGMSPNLEVELAISKTVVLAGSTKSEEVMPRNSQKLYGERERIQDKNISQRSLHEELKEEGFCPRFLSTLKLFSKDNPEQPPT